MSESKTNTNHLERKRLEYLRIKEDFVMLLLSFVEGKKNCPTTTNNQNYQLNHKNYPKFIKR